MRDTRLYVSLLVGLLAALIVMSILMARSIVTPLTALTRAVQSMSLSDEHSGLSRNRRRDELGILIRAYRDMVKRIHAQLIALQDKQNVERMLQAERTKNLEAESLLARSELKVYQSQINSHFLFNAFNTVSRLAYIENAPQVQHAVGLIAQFLRNIMTQFDRQVTVEEEFAIVQNYTQIQELRFGERIKVESSMDSGTEWFVIPAMTIQPLVENAYHHGLSDRKEGYIRYVAEAEEDRIRIYVWDDGRGMPPEDQKALLDDVTKGNDDGLAKESIGLKNVYRRLCLMYPEQVDMIIDGEKGLFSQIGFEIQIG